MYIHNYSIQYTMYMLGDYSLWEAVLTLIRAKVWTGNESEYSHDFVYVHVSWYTPTCCADSSAEGFFEGDQGVLSPPPPGNCLI